MDQLAEVRYYGVTKQQQIFFRKERVKWSEAEWVFLTVEK